jgi:hypothetical protein
MAGQQCKNIVAAVYQVPNGASTVGINVAQIQYGARTRFYLNGGREW